MSGQQESSSKGWIIVITSIIGVIGTITVAYFAFRGAIFPAQLEIEASQTAQSILSTQIADSIWITQTAHSLEVSLSSVPPSQILSPTEDPVAFSPTTIPSATFAPPPTVMPTEPPQNVCDRYEKVPLQLYWSDERQDNFTAAATDSINGAVSPLYYFVRTEGYIFPTPQNDTIPLELYYEGYTRFDNFTMATQAGMEEALRIGYWRVRTEGYVFSAHYPGTVPLDVYWHSGRADNFTTATNEGKTAAQAAGYQRIRTEGYICP